MYHYFALRYHPFDESHATFSYRPVKKRPFVIQLLWGLLILLRFYVFIRCINSVFPASAAIMR